MHNNRIYETSQEEGVAKISRHLTALSYGTCHNGGGSGGEGELEEEVNVVRIKATVK
jgi:hypothetical protein